MSDNNTSGSTETTPGGGEPIVPVVPASRTAEEVEAEWRNRFSNRDRAHAVEKSALESSLTQVTGEREAARQEAKNMTDALEALRKSNEDLQKELAAERAGRAVDARKGKFPQSAGVLDEATLASMAEDNLAALEARLAGNGQPASISQQTPPPPPVLPNTAAKPPQEPPNTDPSAADLKALLMQQPWEQ